MQIYDLIYKKREGEVLSREEIEFVVNKYVKEEVADYQMSAFLMAVFLKGMTKKEIIYLTQSLIMSGEVLNWTGVEGIKIDKHSTGGVGDGTSLVLAPLVAAAGICVPMMCGRGLGHTGGTLDKLESIPGFRINLSVPEFIGQVKTIGLAIIGQTVEINPADRKMYALRDTTATVESIPLIASSIMSKKIAEGTNGLVLDVKIGKGAFMKDRIRAHRLASLMVEIGTKLGLNMVALITNMDQPLGWVVGNALEVKQAIDILKGGGPEDLKTLIFSLGSWMLVLGKKAKNVKEGKKILKELIEQGKALDKFEQMVVAQGGDKKVVYSPDEVLPQAKEKIELCSDGAGYIQSLDARQVGLAAMILGAGREKIDSKIDFAVGIQLHKEIGDRVEKGEVIASFYVNSKEKIEAAKETFFAGCQIGTIKPKIGPLIFEEIK